MRFSLSTSPQRAFTLVELLVVIAIIGILIGMLLPAVQQVREAARRSACSNNIKQLGLALHNYESANSKFPPQPTIDTGGGRKAGVGWQAIIMPFLEQATIGNRVDPAQHSYDAGQNTNRVLGQFRIPVLFCPSYEVFDSLSAFDNITAAEDGSGKKNAYISHYMGNAGPIGTNLFSGKAYESNTSIQGGLACEGVLPSYPSIYGTSIPKKAAGVKIADIYDGTSNTLMTFEFCWFGLELPARGLRSWVRGCCYGDEATSSKNVRYAPKTVIYSGTGSYNNQSMGGNHPGVCMAGYGDGSVHAIPNEIDVNQVLLPISSRGSGETIGVF